MIKSSDVKHVTYTDIFVLFIMVTVSHLLKQHLIFLSNLSLNILCLNASVLDLRETVFPSPIIMAWIWAPGQEAMSCFVYFNLCQIFYYKLALNVDMHLQHLTSLIAIFRRSTAQCE